LKNGAFLARDKDHQALWHLLALAPPNTGELFWSVRCRYRP